MSLSQGFDPPQLSIKARPQSVNNFFQQNFQDHTRFRYFQNYPRYPHAPKMPGNGFQSVAVLQQQQQKQYLQMQKQQQQFQQQHRATESQQYHQQKQQQQQQLLKTRTNSDPKTIIENQNTQSSREEIRNVLSSLKSSDGPKPTERQIQIKEEIVDTLVESMDQEPAVPRFNTNKCLSHKLPSLPPLYSKEVSRKNSFSNVKMRPNEVSSKKSDKKVLSPLQYHDTKSINSPVNMIQSRKNMMASYHYMKTCHSRSQPSFSPPTLLNGSRLQTLLIEGGNPGAERTISKIRSSSSGPGLSLDRIRGSLSAPPPALAPKKRRRRGNMEPGEKYCHICGELASSHSYYGAQVGRLIENLNLRCTAKYSYIINLSSVQYESVCLCQN